MQKSLFRLSSESPRGIFFAKLLTYVHILTNIFHVTPPSRKKAMCASPYIIFFKLAPGSGGGGGGEANNTQRNCPIRLWRQNCSHKTNLFFGDFLRGKKAKKKKNTFFKIFACHPPTQPSFKTLFKRDICTRLHGDATAHTLTPISLTLSI